MKTNRHCAAWLAGLLGLAMLLFANHAAQAQAVRALTNIAGKWGSSTTMIAAGGGHTCTLTGDGLVRCWGSNERGQLGDGTTTDRVTPVLVSGALIDAVAVATGGFHSCGLRANGRVMCWGHNFFGQLGNGGTTSSLTPVTVSGIDNAVSVAAGNIHTCAALASGEVRCWGENNRGQLGNGSSGQSFTPVTVSGITNAVAVTAGEGHSCALLATGTVQCWGSNSSGQLGNGSSMASFRPVTVSGITQAVMVKAGGSFTCALLATGMIQCWGFNDFGTLGDGTKTNRSTPVTVSGISKESLNKSSFFPVKPERGRFFSSAGKETRGLAYG